MNGGRLRKITNGKLRLLTFTILCVAFSYFLSWTIATQLENLTNALASSSARHTKWSTGFWARGPLCPLCITGGYRRFKNQVKVELVKGLHLHFFLTLRDFYLNAWLSKLLQAASVLCCFIFHISFYFVLSCTRELFHDTKLTLSLTLLFFDCTSNEANSINFTLYHW